MASRASTDANVKSTTLAARFVGGPYLSDADCAKQRLVDWRTELAPGEAVKFDDLTARFPCAETILLGIAEASPYLFESMRADGARVLRLLQCEPERHLAELVQRTCHEVAAAGGETAGSGRLPRWNRKPERLSPFEVFGA